VLEDYEKIGNQIREAEEEIRKVVRDILNEESEDRIDTLERIKQESYPKQEGNLNEQMMVMIKVPKKIFL
jgi:hypothetical protein